MNFVIERTVDWLAVADGGSACGTWAYRRERFSGLAVHAVAKYFANATPWDFHVSCGERSRPYSGDGFDGSLAACIWRFHWSLSIWVAPRRATARNQEPSPTGQSTPQVDAAVLWKKVLEKYATAQHYHDDAKLVLRYRMNDRPMEEHQLWAIDFDRSGKLAARIFNCRIQADTQRTLFRVYDWNTANMDDQIVVLPGLDKQIWSRISQDSVCLHFAMGVGELPFAKSLDYQSLVPLAARLLMGAETGDWLHDCQSAEYVADELLGELATQHIQVDYGQGAVGLWVDPKSYRIVQAELPLAYLDPTLQESTEITGLKLSVAFDNATFDPAYCESLFTTEIPDDGQPVCRFVPLPDRFPSDAIGHPLPVLPLVDDSGKSVIWTPSDSATTFLWIDGLEASQTALGQLSSMDLPRLQLVYADYQSDGDLNAAQAETRIRSMLQPYPALARQAVWFDFGNVAGRKLNVQSAPAVVIVDSRGVVQYFQQLVESDWPIKLQAAGAVSPRARIWLGKCGTNTRRLSKNITPN